MNVIFEKNAKNDVIFWQKKNKFIISKIKSLIKNIKVTPYQGIGKPKPLKHNFSGFWSRRINHEHRLVYEVLEEDSIVIIHSCRGHYID
jgi:toxin YoeB